MMRVCWSDSLLMLIEYRAKIHSRRGMKGSSLPYIYQLGALGLTHPYSRGASGNFTDSFPAQAFVATIVLSFGVVALGVLLNIRWNRFITGITAIRANHGVADTLKTRRRGRRAFVIA